VNLLREGIDQERVDVTGNTVIDNLLWVVERRLGTSAFPVGGAGKRILVTLHRRENQGAAMVALAEGILQLTRERDVQVVLPVHRSPAVRASLLPVLAGQPRIHLTEPLDYLDFTATLADAHLALTDSGGVQEEAPTLGVPVLVLRRTTERMEAVRAGAAELVGIDPDVVLARARTLLEDESAHARMAGAPNPFGDGRASERILDRLAADLGAHVVAPSPAPAVARVTAVATAATADAGATTASDFAVVP
jgi:UDP-N-acetylglucosamine 2-epimerase (non-hydrolysing)